MPLIPYLKFPDKKLAETYKKTTNPFLKKMIGSCIFLRKSEFMRNLQEEILLTAGKKELSAIIKLLERTGDINYPPFRILTAPYRHYDDSKKLSQRKFDLIFTWIYQNNPLALVSLYKISTDKVAFLNSIVFKYFDSFVAYFLSHPSNKTEWCPRSYGIFQSLKIIAPQLDNQTFIEFQQFLVSQLIPQLLPSNFFIFLRLQKEMLLSRSNSDDALAMCRLIVNEMFIRLNIKIEFHNGDITNSNMGLASLAANYTHCFQNIMLLFKYPPSVFQQIAFEFINKAEEKCPFTTAVETTTVKATTPAEFIGRTYLEYFFAFILRNFLRSYGNLLSPDLYKKILDFTGKRSSTKALLNLCTRLNRLISSAMNNDGYSEIIREKPIGLEKTQKSSIEYIRDNIYRIIECNKNKDTNLLKMPRPLQFKEMGQITCSKKLMTLMVKKITSFNLPDKEDQSERDMLYVLEALLGEFLSAGNEMLLEKLYFALNRKSVDPQFHSQLVHLVNKISNLVLATTYSSAYPLYPEIQRSLEHLLKTELDEFPGVTNGFRNLKLKVIAPAASSSSSVLYISSHPNSTFYPNAKKNTENTESSLPNLKTNTK
jgi:hypothetical protein